MSKINSSHIIPLDRAELRPGQRIIKEIYGDGSVRYLAAGVGGAAPAVRSSNIYGIIYDPAAVSAADACVKVELRGGNIVEVNSFASMPAHQFRRCVVSDMVNRQIAYYLADDDSNYKRSGELADLTGNDGDVFVEIPITHVRTDNLEDGRIQMLVSDAPFAGSHIHEFFFISPSGTEARTQYISAFRGGLCDEDGTPLWTDENSAKPDVSGTQVRSIAGSKPWTFYKYADWASISNRVNAAGFAYYRFLSMMMAIEFGTVDSQTGFCDGFCNLSGDVDLRYTRLTGRCNFGNGSGYILAAPERDGDLPFADGKTPIVQCCYRGIEDPFGGLAELIAGARMLVTVSGAVVDYELRWTTATDQYSNAASSWAYSITGQLAADRGSWGAFAPSRFWIPLPTAGATSDSGSCDGAICNETYLNAQDEAYIWSNSNMASQQYGGMNAYRFDAGINLSPGEYEVIRLQI